MQVLKLRDAETKGGQVAADHKRQASLEGQHDFDAWL
jgi:hypothetical protein